MLTVSLLSLPILSTGATLYVATTGDDGTGTNDCTVQALPCKTIHNAMAKITTDGTAASPHVINIAKGTYIAGVLFTGEIYPINVTKDYVSLVGDPTDPTEITGGGGYTLSVTSTGLSVQNLKFTSAGTAVNISGGEGGFSFINNIFASSVGTGVYASIYPTVAGSDVSIMPVSFTGNSFACSNYGVDFKTGLDFNGATGLTGTIGSVTATGNTFTGSSTGFYIDESISI